MFIDETANFYTLVGGAILLMVIVENALTGYRVSRYLKLNDGFALLGVGDGLKQSQHYLS